MYSRSPQSPSEGQLLLPNHDQDKKLETEKKKVRLPALTKEVSSQIGLLSLWGYAGWNTSSNSLGTVLCQAVLRFFYGDTKAHRRFTAERAFEDLGYCAYVRKQIWDNEITQMGYSYEDTKVAQGAVSERIEQLLNWFMQNNYPEITNLYKIEKCYLPWRRMFEVGLIITEK